MSHNFVELINDFYSNTFIFYRGLINRVFRGLYYWQIDKILF